MPEVPDDINPGPIPPPPPKPAEPSPPPKLEEGAKCNGACKLSIDGIPLGYCPKHG